MAQAGRDFFERFGGRNSVSLAPVTQTAIDPNAAPMDDVQLLDRAAKELSEQIERNPDDPALYNRLGLIYSGSGEYEKAVATFQKTIDVAHACASQISAREQQYRNTGQIEKASRALLERAKLSVELSAAHSNLARMYDQLGQHDRVAAQLDQINNDIAFAAPTSPKPTTSTAGGGAVSAANHRMAPSVLQMLAHAEGLMQARRIPEAEAEYKKVLESDPLASLARRRLGDIAAMRGNNYLALEELETAVRLDPNDAAARNSLAVAYQTRGQMEKAVEQFEKALALDPQAPQAAFNLGNILLAGNRLVPAKEAYERAVKADPNNALAHNNLATVLSLSGDYTDAITEFEKALTLAPQIASGHYGLGLALFHSGRYPDSIQEFKRALAINPSLIDAQVKMEMAYKKSGLASASRFPIN